MISPSLSSLQRRFTEKICAVSLSSDAKSIRRDRLTYLSARKLHRLERAISRTQKAHIAGDIVEFGVALGGCSVLLAKATSGSRRFFGLDVFSMIPEPCSDKDDPISKERYTEIASGRSSGIGGDLYYGYRRDLFDYVCERMDEYGVPVDDEKIFLIKGLFNDTWPKLDIEAISFAHVDCDWYDPVRFCLHSIAEKLSPGGLVVIDDYNDYDGCRIAVDEFLAARSDFVFEAGVNPILKKKRT